MDRWTNGQTNKWTDGQIDRQKDRHKEIQTDGRKDVWAGRLMGRRAGGCTDVQTKKNRQADRQIFIKPI